jgi:hypothetical protein
MILVGRLACVSPAVLAMLPAALCRIELDHQAPLCSKVIGHCVSMNDMKFLRVPCFLRHEFDTVRAPACTFSEEAESPTGAH